MIRATLALALLAAPAGAAVEADCAALLERVGARAGGTSFTGDACVFSDVEYGDGPSRWRAGRVILSGDVDALPDALPSRLTGGVTGLGLAPEIEGQPGFDWLLREQAKPGISLTFDITAEGGGVAINSLTFRLGDAGEVTASARLSGMPEVWPVDPVAMAGMKLDDMDATIVFDGLFEALVLIPLGTQLLDLTQPAEPQVEALRAGAAAWLAGFEGTALAEDAGEAGAFLDTLPHPRGELGLRVGGTGLSLLQLGSLAGGIASPGFLARIAEAAEVELTWDAEE